MPDNFLDVLLGNNKQTDYASPLQVEIAKALAEKNAPQRMPYDPSVPGSWYGTVANLLGDVNGAIYRNQALRVNQGLIGNRARAAINEVIRPQDKQPTIKPDVVMRRANEPQGSWEPKITLPEGSRIMNLGNKEGTIESDVNKVNTGWDWGDLPIVNGIDEKAPYMDRKRDQKDTKRIVFHGDIKDNVNDILDDKGKVKNLGLLNYGRKVDKQRGFDPNYHFYIDKDGTITQGVPLDRVANHVGNLNKDSIGIVLAGVVGGKQPTPEQEKSARMLAKKLTEYYGLSQSNVFSHPELQPGHREKTEAGNVAADIRMHGFGEPTEADKEEKRIVENELDRGATLNNAEVTRAPLNRGGLTPEQMAQINNARTGQFATEGINPKFAPGSSDFAKNKFAETTVAKTPKEQLAENITTVPKSSLGARELPERKDESRLEGEDKGETPWSAAMKKANKAKEQVLPKEPAYTPEEEQEIESKLPPDASIEETNRKLAHAHGYRTAQNLPDKTGRPGVPQGQKIRSDIPGYNGPIPSLPSLPSESNIAARINDFAIRGDNDGLEEYIDKLKKDMLPVIVKVPNGELHITRKHYPEQNQVQFYPSAEESEISAGGATAPLVTNFDKNGNLQYSIKAPGFANQTFNTKEEATNAWETYIDFAQRTQAQGEATSELTKAKSGTVAQAIEEGTKVMPALQTLNTLDTLSKSMGGWGPRGPTSEYMLKVRQFLDNVGISTKNTPEAEVFNKFNSMLASEATQAFTNRGTNFDLQTFMRANPSLLQSKEGTEMLIDIMRQEYKARQYLGKRANALKGKDVDKYQGIVDEYWNSHPLTFTATINGKPITVNTKPIKDESDLDDLKSGEAFIAPDGKIRRKP